MVTCDRAANGKCDSRERYDDSMGDESRRDETHQSLREEKRVKRAAHDADHGSDATIEQLILRSGQASRKNVSVQHHHHDNGEDCRDLREQPVTDGAEPAIAPRRVSWRRQRYFTENGAAYSLSSHEKRSTPPDP